MFTKMKRRVSALLSFVMLITGAFSYSVLADTTNSGDKMILSAVSDSSSVKVGDSFDVDFTLKNDQGGVIKGYSFIISYDGNCVEPVIPQDSELDELNKIAQVFTTDTAVKDNDNEPQGIEENPMVSAGAVKAALSNGDKKNILSCTFEDNVVASGSGIMFRVKFKAVGESTGTEIKLAQNGSDNLLTGPENAKIDCETVAETIVITSGDKGEGIEFTYDGTGENGTGLKIDVTSKGAVTVDGGIWNDTAKSITLTSATEDVTVDSLIAHMNSKFAGKFEATKDSNGQITVTDKSDSTKTFTFVLVPYQESSDEKIGFTYTNEAMDFTIVATGSAISSVTGAAQLSSDKKTITLSTGDSDDLNNIVSDMQSKLRDNGYNVSYVDRKVTITKTGSSEKLEFNFAIKIVEVKGINFSYFDDEIGIGIVVENGVIISSNGVKVSDDMQTITLNENKETTPGAVAVSMQNQLDNYDVNFNESSDGKSVNVTISVKNDSSKYISFVIKEYENTTPPDDEYATVTVGGDTISFEKGTKGGVKAFVSKGSAKEIVGGAYVPYFGDKNINALSKDDFIVSGTEAEIVEYNTDKMVLTLKIGEDTFAVQMFIYGDVDGNGILDAVDAAIALLKGIGSPTVVFTDKQEFVGDVDSEEGVGINDASLILQKVLDSDNELPSVKK